MLLKCWRLIMNIIIEIFEVGEFLNDSHPLYRQEDRRRIVDDQNRKEPIFSHALWTSSACMDTWLSRGLPVSGSVRQVWEYQCDYDSSVKNCKYYYMYQLFLIRLKLHLWHLICIKNIMGPAPFKSWFFLYIMRSKLQVYNRQIPYPISIKIFLVLTFPLKTWEKNCLF